LLLVSGPDGRAGDSVGYEGFIHEALQRNPEVGALSHQVQAASAALPGAAAWPEPMLEFMLQDVGLPRPTPMSMAVLELRQPLPFPGKRAAREESARAEVGGRMAALHEFRAALVLRLRGLWSRLYGIDRERALVGEGRQLLADLVESASGRYATGQAGLKDALRARLAMARIEERAEDLRAGRQALESELGRMLARPGPVVPPEVTDLPPTERPSRPWLELALERAPTLARARAELLRATRRLEQARLEGRPDFFVGLGAGVTFAPEPVLGLKAGVSLPLWSANREPPVAAAEQELGAALERLRGAEDEVRTRVETLRIALASSAAQVERFRDAIEPQARAALETARLSYESGGQELSDVVDAFEAWLEARLGQARRESMRFEAWAGLRELAGEEGAP
jgi:cobalt-zinc-cadmium efflux system outer membrane protein